MRSPRSVTCAPIGMPSRSLNCAMDLRALVTCGFWPVMAVRSRRAPSMSLPSRAASPTPMLTTILVRPGTCMTFWKPNSSRSAGRISSRYRVFSRGVAAVSVVAMSELLPGLRGDAHAAVRGVSGAVGAALGDLVAAETNARGGLVAVGVDHEHHIGDVDRSLGGDDAA